MKNRKSDKYKTLLPNKSNKTLESITIEQVMDEKWSLHAAIKSSLDLMDRNKFNASIENQEESLKQKQQQKLKDELIETDLQKKALTLSRIIFLRKFIDRCRQCIRRKHYNYAAKFLYEEKLKRKVFLSKAWSSDSDSKLMSRVFKLNQFLEINRKKSVYFKLNKFNTLKKNLDRKIEILEKKVKAKVFQNKGRSRNKNQIMNDQIFQFKKQAPCVDLLQCKQLKQQNLKKTHKNLKKVASQKALYITNKSDIQAKQQITTTNQMIAPATSLEDNQKPSSQNTRTKPRKSILQIKEAIKVDDIRNYIYLNNVNKFIGNLKYSVSCNQLKKFGKELIMKQKGYFVKNLIYHQKQQQIQAIIQLNQVYLFLQLLKSNSKNNKAKTKERKLFLSKSFKAKRKAIQFLSQNREKRMLSNLCLNIIMTKRMAQLELKVFDALRLNVARKKVQTELMQQIKIRREQIILKKAFMRWKYYQPAYLDMTYESQSPREQVSNFYQRQREETGVSELLNKEIKHITWKIFLKRWKKNVDRRTQNNKLIEKREQKLEMLLKKSVGVGKLLRSVIKIIQNGFQSQRIKIEHNNKRNIVEHILVNSRIIYLFKRKHLSPSKISQLLLYRSNKTCHSFFCIFKAALQNSKQTTNNIQKTIASRILMKLIKRKEQLNEVNQKIKYLVELIYKSRLLKLKYRFFNHLRLKSQRGTISEYEQQTNNIFQNQFKDLMETQNAKMKQFFLRIALKRKRWNVLQRNIKVMRHDKNSTKQIEKKKNNLKRFLFQMRSQTFLILMNENQNQLQCKTNQLKLHLNITSKQSFYQNLKSFIQTTNQSLLIKSNQDKLLQYAQRKYQTRLYIKSFLSFRKNRQESSKSRDLELLSKTFSALKDHSHQARLLKHYLGQYKQISYYPESQQQKDQFDSLRMYIDV